MPQLSVGTKSGQLEGRLHTCTNGCNQLRLDSLVEAESGQRSSFEIFRRESQTSGRSGTILPELSANFIARLLRNFADFRQCDSPKPLSATRFRSRLGHTQNRKFIVVARRAAHASVSLPRRRFRAKLSCRGRNASEFYFCANLAGNAHRVKSDDSPSEMSIIAVASRFVANHCPNSILASGRRCLLMSKLRGRTPAFRSCLAIFSP